MEHYINESDVTLATFSESQIECLNDMYADYEAAWWASLEEEHGPFFDSYEEWQKWDEAQRAVERQAKITAARDLSPRSVGSRIPGTAGAIRVRLLDPSARLDRAQHLQTLGIKIRYANA